MKFKEKEIIVGDVLSIVDMFINQLSSPSEKVGVALFKNFFIDTILSTIEEESNQ